MRVGKKSLRYVVSRYYSRLVDKTTVQHDSTSATRTTTRTATLSCSASISDVAVPCVRSAPQCVLSERPFVLLTSPRSLVPPHRVHPPQTLPLLG